MSRERVVRTPPALSRGTSPTTFHGTNISGLYLQHLMLPPAVSD